MFKENNLIFFLLKLIKKEILLTNTSKEKVLK